MDLYTSFGLFMALMTGIIYLLIREILLLNKALDDGTQTIMHLQKKMAKKIDDMSFEKLYLENEIDVLRDKLNIWQKKSQLLNHDVNMLTNKLHAKFDDDQTKETFVRKFRQAS